MSETECGVARLLAGIHSSRAGSSFGVRPAVRDALWGRRASGVLACLAGRLARARRSWKCSANVISSGAAQAASNRRRRHSVGGPRYLAASGGCDTLLCARGQGRGGGQASGDGQAASVRRARASGRLVQRHAVGWHDDQPGTGVGAEMARSTPAAARPPRSSPSLGVPVSVRALCSARGV